MPIWLVRHIIIHYDMNWNHERWLTFHLDFTKHKFRIFILYSLEIGLMFISTIYMRLSKFHFTHKTFYFFNSSISMLQFYEIIPAKIIRHDQTYFHLRNIISDITRFIGWPSVKSFLNEPNLLWLEWMPLNGKLDYICAWMSQQIANVSLLSLIYAN